MRGLGPPNAEFCVGDPFPNAIYRVWGPSRRAILALYVIALFHGRDARGTHGQDARATSIARAAATAWVTISSSPGRSVRGSIRS